MATDGYTRLLYTIFGEKLPKTPRVLGTEATHHLWYPIPTSRFTDNPMLAERVKGLLEYGYTLNEIRKGWGLRRGYDRSRVATNTREADIIFEYIKSAYNNRCAYCDKKTTRLTKDHVIPISKGGEDNMENIVPACWKCNASKHAKNLLDWERFYKLQMHFLGI